MSKAFSSMAEDDVGDSHVLNESLSPGQPMLQTEERIEEINL